MEGPGADDLETGIAARGKIYLKQGGNPNRLISFIKRFIRKKKPEIDGRDENNTVQRTMKIIISDRTNKSSSDN